VTFPPSPETLDFEGRHSIGLLLQKKKKTRRDRRRGKEKISQQKKGKKKGKGGEAKGRSKAVRRGKQSISESSSGKSKGRPDRRGEGGRIRVTRGREATWSKEKGPSFSRGDQPSKKKIFLPSPSQKGGGGLAGRESKRKGTGEVAKRMNDLRGRVSVQRLYLKN